MGIINESPPTTLSDIHLKVIKRLERLGIQLMEEIRFPPYTVDIYIPSAHIAVEVDGPHHKKKKDEKRDKKLLDIYNLPVIRLTMGQAKKAHIVKETVLEAIDEWKDSAEDRFNIVEEKLPWI